MHADRLVLYPAHQDPAQNAWQVTDRIVLDSSLAGGHAIAVGDLLGLGEDQVIAGWRLPNGEGEVGLKLYRRVEGERFEGIWIDRNQMATEDAIVADLDGDSDLDIIAAGRATKNLKVYWNQLRSSE